MPCVKCNADFNLLNWKLKCVECEQNHCSKCLRKQDNYALCGVCSVLIKRPPNREELMDLKVKDLQSYLNKHKISTVGLVEKSELVELFFRRSIPVRYKKSNRKFNIELGGSVPNLSARSQAYFTEIRNNAEAAFQNTTRNIPRPTSNTFSFNAAQFTSSPRQTSSSHQSFNRQPPPRPPPPRQSPTTSTSDQNNKETTNVPRKYPKLSDYEDIKDLSNLSVKELKELLTLNRVDFKGCVEKAELLDKVERLWNDNNKQKEGDFSENLEECCKICMDAALDCVLLECGHIATCVECGKKLSECPICRQYVTRVVRTFKA